MHLVGPRTELAAYMRIHTRIAMNASYGRQSLAVYYPPLLGLVRKVDVARYYAALSYWLCLQGSLKGSLSFRLLPALTYSGRLFGTALLLPTIRQSYGYRN